jgi:hypothetical protein
VEEEVERAKDIPLPVFFCGNTQKKRAVENSTARFFSKAIFTCPFPDR